MRLFKGNIIIVLISLFGLDSFAYTIQYQNNLTQVLRSEVVVERKDIQKVNRNSQKMLFDNKDFLRENKKSFPSIDSVDAYLQKAVEKGFSGIVLIAKGDKILFMNPIVETHLF